MQARCKKKILDTLPLIAAAWLQCAGLAVSSATAVVAGFGLCNFVYNDENDERTKMMKMKVSCSRNIVAIAAAADSDSDDASSRDDTSVRSRSTSVICGSIHTHTAILAVTLIGAGRD